MIIKDKIQEIVEIFYQQPFKTFYVNSVDGDSFVKPIGIFVSLGITTSKKVIEDISEIIANTGGYSTILAEISSKKVGNKYLNTITTLDDPQQYFLGDLDDTILDEEKAKEELERLTDLIENDDEENIDVLLKYAPRKTKLQELINKLSESSDGWNLHKIQKDEDENYRIYHQLVNYKKTDDDMEYRIGIFVKQ